MTWPRLVVTYNSNNPRSSELAMSENPYTEIVAKLIRRFATVLSYAGVSSEDAAAMLLSAYDDHAESALALPQSVNVLGPNVKLLSRLLVNWSREPNYVDDMGETLAIPVDGPAPSFRALFDDVLETFAIDDLELSSDQVLDVLLEHETIERLEDGRLQLRSPWLHFRAGDSTTSLIQLEHLLAYLQTVILNIEVPAGDGLFERLAAVSDLPINRIGLIDKMLRDEGMQVLETFDQQLEDYAQSSDAAPHERCTAGIGLYFFFESNHGDSATREIVSELLPSHPQE
jgi:hypothetical protein